MNTSGDAAEQIIRLSLEGVEVVAKISGEATKNIAVMLYTIMKDKKMSKGKTQLTNMLKTGKELKIFPLKREDLKKFSKEAKRYGVLFCALADRKDKSPDSIVDIMVKVEDASTINRIVERFNLTTVEPSKMKNEIAEDIGQDIISKENSPHDNMIDDIMGIPISKEEQTTTNPSITKTEVGSLLEHSLKNKEETEESINKIEKTSVKEDLEKIKKEINSKCELRDSKEDLNKEEKQKNIKNYKHMKKIKTKKKRKEKERNK